MFETSQIDTNKVNEAWLMLDETIRDRFSTATPEDLLAIATAFDQHAQSLRSKAAGMAPSGDGLRIFG